ncbi:MAG: hypothetical protein AAF960_24165 [Bacteroidota bacterium]
MKKGILLSIMVTALTLVASAQEGQDYILTLRKDTIFGKIKFNTRESHITFMHKRKRIHFHPKTLPAFGIYDKKKGYRCYKAITNAVGKSMFVEVLNEGKVKLYKYKILADFQHGTHQRDYYFIGRSDNKLVTLTPRSYSVAMRALIKDYPELIPELERTSYQQVPNLVASINQQ